MERVLPDIDAHYGDRRADLLRHGVLLGFGAPSQLRLLAGQEHGRTSPLADLARPFPSVLLLVPVRCALGVAMKRREFISLIGGAAATWPLAVQAQQGGKRHIVGLLSAGGSGVQAALNSAFVDGLRERGWVEGKNVRPRP